MKVEVRESQIEEALVGVSSLTSGLLNLQENPRLLMRQMPVPSGRLDLLYVYQNKLLLLELKVVRFQSKFLKQILDYKKDLAEYQRAGKLVTGEIEPHLLCTDASNADYSVANQHSVNLTRYSPQEVLDDFYKNFKPIVFFTETKPIDIGIWNLKLINNFIYHLQKTGSVKKLQNLVGGSAKTLYNKIKFATELRLVEWKPNRDSICLTELGGEYVGKQNAELPAQLSEEQADVLRTFVMKNPYESSVVVGIAAVVEAVFVLCKNCHPVPMEILTDYFPQYSGKHFDWKTPKSKFNGTRMYSNYAVELGLLAKTESTVYLTPAGFHFTIQMQMHKNLKMVSAMPQ